MADYLTDKLVELSASTLSEDDIATFETRLGATLPAPYREFLAAHNGGLVTGRNWENSDQGYSIVTWHRGSRAEARPAIVEGGDLLHLHSTGEDDFESVEYVLDMLAEIAGGQPRLPAGALPIGHGGGGHFVLMLSGPLKGAVLFWDRTPIPGVTTDDLGYVAPTFEAYLVALREEPEDWDDLEAEAGAAVDPR